MNKNLTLLLFLFVPYTLRAEELQDALRAQPICLVREVAPCAFVNESVNVVDGGLYLSMRHIRVPGHVPLDLIQYYNNKSKFTSWFGTGMTLNYSFWIQGTVDVKSGHDYDGVMAESAGGSIISCIAKSIEEGSQKYFLDPAVIHKGFTNCGSSEISARTNLKNCCIKEKIIDDEEEYYKWTCYLPDGTRRYYKKGEDQEDLVVVKEEKRPNNTRLEFDYSKRHLKQDSIKSITAKAHSTLNRLEFSRSSKKRKAKVVASNGKEVRFSSFKKNDRHYIQKIESSDSPTYHFRYKAAGQDYSISRIELPEGRFLEIDYDKKGRVTAQKAPVGKDGEKRTLFTFDYHDDHTTVLDANKHKKIYYHSNNRITDIEEYKNDSLYRVKAYYWGKKEGLSWGKHPTGREGNLLGYATLNHERCAQALCFFDYDDYGNILRETTAGNLSGNYPWAFWVDDEARPKDPNVECYQKYYKYSKDYLLIEQREDFGPRIEYCYKSGTDLISAKFTKDSENIVKREFFAYDDNSILIEKIIDDGSSDTLSDLTSVTMRLVTKIEPTATGLPQGVREYYLDLATNTLTPLIHTHYNYNKAGDITEEAIFDADGVYRYSSWYEYDHKGRLHKKTNPLGQIQTFVYDENGNKTYEKQEDSEMHIINKYDAANRLVDATEYHYDNTSVSSQFEYDLMGNKIAAIDRYGNKTQFRYDDCNRLIEIELPKKGFTIKKEYDLFDNVCCEINEKHAAVRTEYTIRNKPSKITYSDGSEERFQYNKKGTLFKKWDKSGTRTMYHYDKFDRITRTYVHDTDGNKLLETENTYNTFHLLASKDARGNTRLYSYDGAGRIIEELVETQENYEKKAFSYDSLGRLSSTKQFYGKNRNAFFEIRLEYDNLDRIICERELDSEGICKSETRYQYNAEGMLTRKDTSDAAVINRYNSKKELIETIDEAGERVEIAYRHTFTNHKGQKILQKITKDGLNNSVEEYYDELGRCISTLRKNSQGKLTHVTDYRYNPTGQKIREKNRIFFNGNLEKDYVISWKYDLQDRLIRIVEQPHTTERKETNYSYDLAGRIKSIQKPDGTLLEHTYDALGRLANLKSSDGSVSYSYSYDRNNNPRKIVDEVHGLTTKRVYDAWNRLVRDGIENVYSVNMRYDALGRLKKIKLPDSSSIGYSYDDMHLRSVSRYCQDKALLYSHEYSSFDKEHRPTHVELINNLGTATLLWDKKGRHIGLNSPYYTHSIDAFDPVGNITAYSFEDLQGKVAVQNSYDDLYQLTNESGYKNHSYAHDSLHNRRELDDTTYNLDCHNKVLSDGNLSYSYDINGNPLSDNKRSYKYDALNRLIEVCEAGTTTRYLYDSFNRRIKKNDDFFIYQEMSEIGKLHNGKIEELRILGLGKAGELGAAIALELEGKLYCPLHDFRGNVTVLVDANTKEIAQTYRYTAFGESEPSTSLISPWQFSSKRSDPETGLIYFHCRHYNPALGRFLTPDPLGFADGPNLYAFVHNNPLSNFDLYGLRAEENRDTGRVVTRDGCDVYHVVRTEIRKGENFENYAYEIPGLSKSYAFDIGDKEFPNTKIYVINGIWTSENSARNNFSYFSNLGDGIKVRGIYNATHRILDLIEALLQTKFGIYSAPSKILANELNELRSYEQAYIFSFSQGAIVAQHAFELCNEEVRPRIHSVTFGGAAVIPDTLVGSSYNYASTHDFVTRLADTMGSIVHRKNLQYLTPHPDACQYFDHEFQSPTYREVLQQHIQAIKSRALLER